MTTTELSTIRQYLAWQEEQILNGNASPTVEQYEEHLRVDDIEDRLNQIKQLATDGMPGEKPDVLLGMIAVLADVRA